MWVEKIIFNTRGVVKGETFEVIYYISKRELEIKRWFVSATAFV